MDAGVIEGYGVFGKFWFWMESMVKEAEFCFGCVYTDAPLGAEGQELGYVAGKPVYNALSVPDARAGNVC